MRKKTFNTNIMIMNEDVNNNESLNNENVNNPYAGMDNHTLMKTLLRELNAYYEEDEDGTITFSYQGEEFLMFAEADDWIVRIVDKMWFKCPLDHLEEISCMQKAINTANDRQMASAVYAFDTEEQIMFVYGKYEFVFYNQIPDPSMYLAVVLGRFFHLQRKTMLEFEKEKQKIGLTD